jgi:hypothetical protein
MNNGIDRSLLTSLCGDVYDAPTIVLVGPARDVIRGVAIGGDDLYGYSDPDFEYQHDDAGDGAQW